MNKTRLAFGAVVLALIAGSVWWCTPRASTPLVPSPVTVLAAPSHTTVGTKAQPATWVVAVKTATKAAAREHWYDEVASDVAAAEYYCALREVEVACEGDVCAVRLEVPDFWASVRRRPRLPLEYVAVHALGLPGAISPCYTASLDVPPNNAQWTPTRLLVDPPVNAGCWIMVRGEVPITGEQKQAAARTCEETARRAGGRDQGTYLF